MSIGGDIMEEIYDSRIKSFLEKLQVMTLDTELEIRLLTDIIKMYKEHFKSYGIYE